MFNFAKTDIQRIAVSSLGAIAVSATCLLAAAAPVKAATPQSTAEWQSRIEHRIATIRDDSPQPGALSEAEVAVHFTADGDFAGATLARSSGNGQVDRHALDVARRIAYPALPARYRGAAQTVRMRLYFGTPATAAAYDELQARSHKIQLADAARGTGVQIAAR